MCTVLFATVKISQPTEKVVRVVLESMSTGNNASTAAGWSTGQLDSRGSPSRPSLPTAKLMRPRSIPNFTVTIEQ